MDELEREHQEQICLLRRELDLALQDRAISEQKVTDLQVELARSFMKRDNSNVINDDIFQVLMDIKQGVEQLQSDISMGFLRRLFK